MYPRTASNPRVADTANHGGRGTADGSERTNAERSPGASRLAPSDGRYIICQLVQPRRFVDPTPDIAVRSTPGVTLELESLIGLFYADAAALGQFQSVARADTPPVYRALLHHEHHMTVTVENFHGGPVDVEVLETRTDGDRYARKILLRRQSDGAVVQFGIVRINLGIVDASVRQAIESQKLPLGRVLIEHGVLRKIHLLQLWRVRPGPDLCQMFTMRPDQATYGRTAVIECNGEAAVELLEIVTPVVE